MRASITLSTISRFAVAVAAFWMYGAGSAWAGGGGESLTTLQAVIGNPAGTSGFCSILGMGTSFGNTCPQLPTFTQAILEAAGLENSPPEMVAIQNGLPPGNNVYAGNPVPQSGMVPFPFPLSATTAPILSDFLATLTPLAFISSQKAPTPVQLYDSNANTFLYAAAVSTIGESLAPGGTIPDTLYLFYDNLSRTNQNLKTGQIVAKFSLPLTVLNSNGSERAVPTTLNFAATKAGDCSASTVTGNFSGAPSGTQALMASQIGISCAVVFGASPTSSGSHAVFELAVPLLVTGACFPTTLGPFCPNLPLTSPPNTDPAYFYSFRNPGKASQINIGLYTAFALFDDAFGTPPSATPPILGANGFAIGIAPTAGPLGPPSSGIFAFCASLPGGNGNGQAPVPSVAAYYAIATDGEALLSASLSSTSVCPAL